MPGSASALHLAASLEQLHTAFLALVLPKVLSHGQVWSRHIKCPHRRDDFIAEMVGLSWKWFVRLVERGKDPTEFPTALAGFAARAVRAGRRVAGQERARDVLSPLAQARHGFVVENLPDRETLSSNPLTLALQDNRRTPVADAVAFRHDFPLWLSTLGDRNRRIVEDMILGERTLDLADRHGISPARVSQLRREFRRGWKIFCGDELLGV
jgi:hypothetical protein